MPRLNNCVSGQIQFAAKDCSLGIILVAKSERGICAILIGDDLNELMLDLQSRFPQAQLTQGNQQFAPVVKKVVGFIDTLPMSFDLPLDINGTEFQKKVWEALRKIPRGTTVSYSDIAQRIAAPKAMRAVARACAANPLAVVVPCHRVIKNNGSLSGYRWGVKRKEILLKREAQLFHPLAEV